MKHYIQNNLLKLLFLEETTEGFEKLKQSIDSDLLPLELELKQDLSQALTDLHLGSIPSPQAILININSPIDQLVRFIEQYELLIAPQASMTLLFLTSDHPSILADSLLQRFSIISGCIEKAYTRKAVEEIARKLLVLSQANFQQLDREVA